MPAWSFEHGRCVDVPLWPLPFWRTYTLDSIVEQAATIDVGTSVDPATQSWAIIVGWGIATLFVVFGLGLMFANATNIERPIVVGAFTAVGGLLIAGLMLRTEALNGPYSWWQIAGFTVVGFACFGWGRLLDYVLGPVPVNREADEETLGAHLSD